MELMIPTAWDKFRDVCIDTYETIKNVLSTVLGWGMLLTSYIYTVFGDKATLLNWVLLAMLFDLFFGSWAALKMKRFHISTALVSTAIKLVMYVTLFFVPMILEDILGFKDFKTLTCLVAAFLFCAEVFSIMAHMLIIKSDLIAIKIVRKALIGEIARKLKLPISKVMEMFEIIDKKKKDE
jgi:hypothetical protein